VAHPELKHRLLELSKKITINSGGHVSVHLSGGAINTDVFGGNYSS